MTTYSFNQLVISKRTGLNPRQNFKLGFGTNHYVTIKEIRDGKIVITDKTEKIDDSALALIQKRSKLKKGDILFASIGRIGETAIIEDDPKDWNVNESVFVFTVDTSKILPDFFCFLLGSQRLADLLNKKSTGSTFRSIKMGQLEQLSFNIPPLIDQKKIVSDLHEIKRAIGETKNAILETDNLIKSRFVEMFGDPDTSPKYSSEKLGKLGRLDRGVSKARPRNEPSLIGGPYPLVQTGDVANSGLFINKYSSTYSEKGLAQSKMWKKGTLCITIAANIAETGILNFEACFPDSLVGFVPGHSIDNIYLHYWFEFEKKQISERTVCVAQKNLNLSSLRNFDIELPPIEEQKRFESFALQIDKLKFLIQKEKSLLDELLSLKMHQFFD
jgi:type I restriction enzyme S subunit